MGKANTHPGSESAYLLERTARSQVAGEIHEAPPAVVKP